MRCLVVLAVLCAGCKGKRAPQRDDKPPPRSLDAAVADAAVDAARPDAAVMPTTITSDGVGPITRKTTAPGAFRRLLPGFTVETEHHEAEDYSFDELTILKGKTRILRAVVEEDRLFKVEVEDPLFKTEAGVAVGMTVDELTARVKDLECSYEIYDPEADAERVERALRCESASLPHVLFEIDHEGFEGEQGGIRPKVIAKRTIAEIVWLAAPR
jgi:hypothetical protein